MIEEVNWKRNNAWNIKDMKAQALSWNRQLRSTPLPTRFLNIGYYLNCTPFQQGDTETQLRKYSHCHGWVELFLHQLLECLCKSKSSKYVCIMIYSQDAVQYMSQNCKSDVYFVFMKVIFSHQDLTLGTYATLAVLY